MTMANYPSSLIEKVNALLAEFYPPRVEDGQKLFEISYYGTGVWILGGSMTPVGIEFVVEKLKEKGADVAAIEREIGDCEATVRVRSRRIHELRASARAKLTAEEIEACGI